jgi:hypothetical protein
MKGGFDIFCRPCETLTIQIMSSISKVKIPTALATTLFWSATLGATLSEAAGVIPQSGLSASKSGHDLIFSFPTTSPNLYTLQTSPDLGQPWTNSPSVTQGDGTMKSLTVTNALAGSRGFFRLLAQPPTSLILPQGTAFAILGYDCGGITEHAYVTGFDPATGYPMGIVNLSTSCSGSGRGGHSTTHTGSAAVTWDFSGNVVSATALSNSVATSSTFIATDPSGNTIYNVGAVAYLVVPLPGAPVGVTAVQSEDQFQVSWVPVGINPASVVSSTVTATPVNSANPVITTTVTGTATTGILSPLEPQTTYQITVVTTCISGSSPASAAINVESSPATIPPSAPTGVTASWSNPDPSGTTDSLIAAWPATVPGNSPIDEYLVKIIGSDGGGSYTNTVSGTTLTTYFNVDFTPNWSVTVQAHNADGWGPVSSAVQLGGL